MSYFDSLYAPGIRAATGTPAPWSEWWFRDPYTGFMADASGSSGDVALTLSYVFSAVSIIADDFGTMTCKVFEESADGGSRRVGIGEPGIGRVAMLLRWQPNAWQTAKAFWSTLAWQYLLRRAAYAEIIYRPGAPNVIDQIIPRHPDRVLQEPIANGRVRFQILEPGGGRRTVSQDDMFVVRNNSLDGLNALSRIEYGAKAITSGLALQDYTKNFFQSGTASSTAVIYKGGKAESEWEDDLHASIKRYVSGTEHAGGLLVIPEDVDVKQLGVEPDKAQLLGLKNYTGRDIARIFKMPPSWLGVEGAQSYASYVQDCEVYKTRCQVPMVVEFQQAIWRDLLIAMRYFAKFNMDYLARMDFKSRMEGYEVGIRARVLRPSECRRNEDMNPDEELDRLSAADHRPGTPKNAPTPAAPSSQRAHAIALAAARRVVKRETAAIATAAQKHAKDGPQFEAWADGFYREHVAMVEQAMGMDTDEAGWYCEGQRARLARSGLACVSQWEADAPGRLAALALGMAEAA